MIERDGKKYIIHDGIMNEVLHVIPRKNFKENGGTYAFPEFYICYDGFNVIAMTKQGNPYLHDNGDITRIEYIKYTIKEAENTYDKMWDGENRKLFFVVLETLKKINRTFKIDTLEGREKGISGYHCQTLAC